MYFMIVLVFYLEVSVQVILDNMVLNHQISAYYQSNSVVLIHLFGVCYALPSAYLQPLSKKSMDYYIIVILYSIFKLNREKFKYIPFFSHQRNYLMK